MLLYFVKSNGKNVIGPSSIDTAFFVKMIFSLIAGSIDARFFSHSAIQSGLHSKEYTLAL